MLVAFASAFKASKPSEGFVVIVKLDKVLSATQPVSRRWRKMS
jgi:hypothetical protein